MNLLATLDRRGLTYWLTPDGIFHVAPAAKVTDDLRGPIAEYAEKCRLKYVPGPYQTTWPDVVVWCKHEDLSGNNTLRLTRKRKSNGAVMYKVQCPLCGKKGGEVSHKILQEHEKKEAVPPIGWPDVAELPVVREAQAKGEEGRRQHFQKKQELWQKHFIQWRQEHKAYLQSAYWRAFRQRIMERDNHLCQSCLSAPASDVHHLYDLYGMDVYNYAYEERAYMLAAVCRACHDQIHRRGQS